MANGNFASRLTEQRKARGLSQKQAAADLGVSQALLSHYENGIRECGLAFVVRAAEYYGVSCDYLLGRTTNEISLEAGPQLADTPEDVNWTTNTILRAALAAGGYVTKDTQMKQFVKTVFSLATYFIVAAGVKRKIFPVSWLGQNSENPKQYQFLIVSFLHSLEDITPRNTAPRSLKVPASVATVTSWISDYLNTKLAELL
ncbi:MAG TPA: helix-turn-helix transcriptional regulator [Clostridiales bacterium]|nr:helix-turn-helix transcriptional regulator [Clostridiales bacterium]